MCVWGGGGGGERCSLSLFAETGIPVARTFCKLIHAFSFCRMRSNVRKVWVLSVCRGVTERESCLHLIMFFCKEIIPPPVPRTAKEIRIQKAFTETSIRSWTDSALRQPRF